MKGAIQIQSLIGKADNLPTLPGIAIKLLQAVQKQEPNINEISKILSSDIALAAKILKMVNSSFYSLSSRITTVDHAIKLLGLNTVKNLALSFSLITVLHKKGGVNINYAQFWKDSLLGAIATKSIAKTIHPSSVEDAFFLGLLQDIGSLALACCLPEQYCVILSESNRHVAQYHQMENHHLGLNHMEVGEYLTKSWGLPAAFYIPIGHHHDPSQLSEKDADCSTRTKLLHLSSLYIDVFNTPDINIQLKTIDHFIQQYGFTGKFNTADLAKEIHQQAQDVFPIFDIQLKDDKDYANLLEKAKLEVAKLSFEMINELLEKNKEIQSLREQTNLDGMTSILNYKGFCEAFGRELSRAERYKSPLSLIFADIDYFKNVNDTFGHQAGDHALKAVAVCLKKGIRESDILARYGGEEFALILPETDIDSALLVAERLRKAVQSQQISFKDKTIAVTMSFGVACLPSNQNLSSDSFIKLADDALYKAKRKGRNSCCTA